MNEVKLTETKIDVKVDANFLSKTIVPDGDDQEGLIQETNTVERRDPGKDRWISSDEEEEGGNDDYHRINIAPVKLSNKVDITAVESNLTEIGEVHEVDVVTEFMTDLEEEEEEPAETMETDEEKQASSVSPVPSTATPSMDTSVSKALVEETRAGGVEPETPPPSLGVPASVNAINAETKIHNPLFHGCRSVDSYQRVRYIDQGTYGMVYQARCKTTGTMYALKQVKMGKETNRFGFPITALRETNILLALQHPNIIQVREMVIGSTTDKVYMVMEYMDNDLKSCIEQCKQPLTTSEVKQLMLQLLSAVEHMHRHWYIHRDLKTSNLLYSNQGKLAVCDFGMARKYGSPVVPYTFEVITLWYRPPELLLGAREYSTAVDVWSCGCILGELLLRKPMFDGRGEADQLTKIFRVLGAPTESSWPGFSKLPLADKLGARLPTRSKMRELFPIASFAGGICLSDTGFDLISRLLCADPRQRISALDAYSHPWFTEAPLPTPIDQMPKFKSAMDGKEEH